MRIEKLFGSEEPIYVDLASREPPLNRLVFLYGENGSGKTTILEMIFHALAPAQDRGHRNRLSQISFGSLEIGFAEGQHLKVFRRGSATRGEIHLEYNNRNVTLEARYIPKKSDEPGDPSGLSKLYRELSADLRIQLHYIPENRQYVSATRNSEVRAETLTERYVYKQDQGRRWLEPVHSDRNLIAAQPIESMLEKFAQWLRRRALVAVQQGTVTAHDVVRRAVERAATNAVSVPPDIQATIAKIETLNHTLSAFKSFKLATVPELLPFAETLRSTTPDRVSHVLNAIEPYLESIEARLKTYQALHESLSNLQVSLQEFFGNKRVAVSVSEGIVIKSKKNEELEPNLLSSGERQLLFLMTSAVMARGASALFIIDEPEISLNIKWQRRLIQALIDCSPAQFIIASHSIEVLTPFQESIVELVADS